MPTVYKRKLHDALNLFCPYATTQDNTTMDKYKITCRICLAKSDKDVHKALYVHKKSKDGDMRGRKV
jgi:hypothetical protein